MYIKGTANSESLFGGAGADVMLGHGGHDRMYGRAGDDVISGGDGSDTIYGEDGNDTLYGGTGNDRLIGGAGADRLSGGSGIDTADYRSSGQRVQVNLLANTGAYGDSEGDTYSSIENLHGSAFDDVLAGNNVSNVIYGNGGDDIISGYGGNDTLVGGAGNDVLGYGFAEAGDDVLLGGDGNDVLLGGPGADVNNGGAGVDTVSYILSDTRIGADLSTGSGFGEAGGGDAVGDTYIGIENLTGSNLGDRLYGDSGANVIRGLAGDDQIRGGAGADTLYGGSGFDVLLYDTSSAAVVVDLGRVAANGSQFVSGGDASGDTVFEFEHVSGSQFNDVLYGSGAANQLYGNAGNDLINASAGNDRLDGGAGNDRLIGAAGADYIDGGSGSDTADYSSSRAGVSVHLAPSSVELVSAGLVYEFSHEESAEGGDAEGDTLVGIENIIGSAYDDVLYGTPAYNDIFGGDGNDQIAGGAGGDRLNGGSGTDTLAYLFSNQGVHVDFGRAIARGGDAEGDIFANFENLGGSFYDDVLAGNAGDNRIFGLTGNDVMSGGGGSDTFVFDATASQWLFGLPEGNDVITDFQVGEDRLELGSVNSLDNLSFEQVGADTMITYGDPMLGSIRLAGVDLQDLLQNATTDLVFI